MRNILFVNNQSTKKRLDMLITLARVGSIIRSNTRSRGQRY